MNLLEPLCRFAVWRAVGLALLHLLGQEAALGLGFWVFRSNTKTRIPETQSPG